MPHLAFYASTGDIEKVAAFILGDAGCVIYESYSVPDCPLRKFENPAQIRDVCEDRTSTLFCIYSPSMGGVLRTRRIELKPEALAGQTWRETLEGWGFISLHVGIIRNGALSPSDTNHNSLARATRWEPTYPESGPVNAWDFDEVTRISRKINRYVSVHLAVRKQGARPVLAGAQALVDSGNITFASL